MCPASTTRSARPRLGAGHDVVAVPVDGQVRQRAQGRLDGVGEVLLLPADRREVDEPGGELPAASRARSSVCPSMATSLRDRASPTPVLPSSTVGPVPRSSSAPRRSRLAPCRGRLRRARRRWPATWPCSTSPATRARPAAPWAPRTAARGVRTSCSPEQAANAATISAVGTTRGLPERAVTIALATALQESALRNIDHGDRDSLGLFQQRPSQGWGTPQQIMDPVYSAGKFYEHLAEVPGYSRLPLTVAAQRVQQQRVPAGVRQARAGRRAAGRRADRPGPRLADLLACRRRRPRARGTRPRCGPTWCAPSARTSCRPPGRRAPRRRARCRCPCGPGTASTSQHGWELAHWAVARAGTLRITEVSYAGRVWTSRHGLADGA